jgi:hypothetical protein
MLLPEMTLDCMTSSSLRGQGKSERCICLQGPLRGSHARPWRARAAQRLIRTDGPRTLRTLISGGPGPPTSQCPRNVELRASSRLAHAAAVPGCDIPLVCHFETPSTWSYSAPAHDDTRHTLFGCSGVYGLHLSDAPGVRLVSSPHSPRWGSVLVVSPRRLRRCGKIPIVLRWRF